MIMCGVSLGVYLVSANKWCLKGYVCDKGVIEGV